MTSIDPVAKNTGVRVSISGPRERNIVSCFITYKGRLLLLRRSERQKTYPGRWATISGSVRDEPLAQAFRELLKETGLQPTDLRLVKRGVTVDIDDPSGSNLWLIHPLLFRSLVDRVVLSWQHSEYRWVTPSLLSHYPVVPMLEAALTNAWDVVELGPSPENLGKPRDTLDSSATDARVQLASAIPKKDALFRIETAPQILGKPGDMLHPPAAVARAQLESAAPKKDATFKIEKPLPGTEPVRAPWDDAPPIGTETPEPVAHTPTPAAQTSEARPGASNTAFRYSWPSAETPSPAAAAVRPTLAPSGVGSTLSGSDFRDIRPELVGRASDFSSSKSVRASLYVIRDREVLAPDSEITDEEEPEEIADDAELLETPTIPPSMWSAALPTSFSSALKALAEPDRRPSESYSPSKTKPDSGRAPSLFRLDLSDAEHRSEAGSSHSAGPRTIPGTPDGGVRVRLMKGVPITRSPEVAELPSGGAIGSIATGSALLVSQPVQSLLRSLLRRSGEVSEATTEMILEALGTFGDLSSAPSLVRWLADLALAARALVDLRPFRAETAQAIAQVLYDTERHLAPIAPLPSRSRMRAVLADCIRQVPRRHQVREDRLSDEVCKLISPGASVLTFGYCGALVEAIRRCPQFGVRVVIPDVNPGGERERMERELRKQQTLVTVINPEDLSFHLRETDLMIFGGHTLLANGFVIARSGCENVAMAARAARVPVYTAATLSRLDLSPSSSDEPTGMAGTVPSVVVSWDAALDESGLARISSSFVTAIVSERGLLEPACLAWEVRAREHLRRVIWPNVGLPVRDA